MTLHLPVITRTFTKYQVHKVVFRCLSHRVKDERTKALLDKIIRIDHAGEFGAKRIYQGQLAVLRDTPSGPIIEVQLIHFQYILYINIIDMSSYIKLVIARLLIII